MDGVLGFGTGDPWYDSQVKPSSVSDPDVKIKEARL